MHDDVHVDVEVFAMFAKLATSKNCFFPTLSFALLVFFIYACADTVWADPVISSLTGSLAHGARVTITGSNFGAKLSAAPVAWDNLEDGKADKVATVGSWGDTGYPGGIMAATNTHRRNENSVYSAYCKVPGNGNEYCAFRMHDGSAAKWFIQYWVYVGENWKWENGNIKILRLWNSSTCNLRVQAPFNNVDIVVENSDIGHGGYNVGWTPVTSSLKYVDQYYGYGAPKEILPGSLGWNHYRDIIKNGKWHLFQWEYAEGSDSNGVLRWWVDGALIFDRHDIDTGNRNKYPFIVGWYMSNSNDGNGDLYFDDVYVDKTWSRVELGDANSYNLCHIREIQIPTAWSDDSITVTVNQGSFKKGDTAYLFVVDANGNVSNGYPITIGGGNGTPSDNPPSVSITNPTSGDTYSTSEGTISISGNASDDNGISSITWSNNRGGSGSAVNSSGDWSDWSISGINLQEGENVITVTATDTNNQTATDTITVNYAAGGGEQMWSATSQTGDSQWKDSSVTYCVRLLIKGSNIPTSGNQVRLAFQGRSSGSYSIHNVSIAERDTNAPEGDVIDSTWTRVTFDGKAWNSQTTVAAGSEKISDPVYINFKPGSDYYVTFKIDTPSVYLNPPSDYRELYFYNEDHSTDIDWSGNGHSTTQDYHALSKIYVIGNSSDTTPPGDVTDFNAEPGPGKVTLSWTNPSDSDFAGVMIRYRTDGTFPQNYTDGMAVPNGNNGRIAGQPNVQGSYVHSGLDSNLTYYYSIFTYDTTGNYSHTAHASATPLPVGGSNQSPAISGFSAAPNPANNPHKKITFTVTANDSDGDPLSYKINFGDGTSSSSGSTVTHAYNTKGTYNVTATVSDNHGHSVSKTLQVVVNDNKPVKVTGVQAK